MLKCEECDLFLRPQQPKLLLITRRSPLFPLRLLTTACRPLPAACTAWLAHLSLVANTRSAYPFVASARISPLTHWITADPFTHPHTCNYAVRDFKLDYKTAS